MAVKVWFNKEGDVLEVTFEKRKGFMKDVGNDTWLRVDSKGRVIGFLIIGATHIHKKTKEISLPITGRLNYA